MLFVIEAVKFKYTLHELIDIINCSISINQIHRRVASIIFVVCNRSSNLNNFTSYALNRST